MLERAVELWVSTLILVDTDLTWKTYCNPTLPPTSMHTLSQPNDEGRLPIDEVTDAESYGLLCSQLRAGMEKRAMQLSKSVINDLERRLLQRQKTGYFETFLIAMVLLNCVERTCWLFQSWDNEDFAQRVSGHLPVTSSQSTNSIYSGHWTSVLPTITARPSTLPKFCTCCFGCAAFRPRPLSVLTTALLRPRRAVTRTPCAGST